MNVGQLQKGWERLGHQNDKDVKIALDFYAAFTGGDDMHSA